MTAHDKRWMFDEVEEDTVLRTLIDWKLFNADGDMVPLDALGEGKPLCSVTGRLVKPLPKSVRLKVVENLCTFGVLKDGAEKEAVVVQEPLVKEVVPLEWDNIKVGDCLDGYWYILTHVA